MKKKLDDDLKKLNDSEFSDLVESISFLPKDEKNFDEDGHEKKKIKISKFTKYFTTATGFIYTLTAPCILLVTIYYILVKYYFFKSKPVLLIVLIVLGILTGYWSLFKEIGGHKK